MGKFVHGGTRRGHHDRLYGIYCGIKNRCYNPNRKNYPRYGGRGITVCDEWMGENGYAIFREWAMKNGYDPEAPYMQCTIDRIDSNGPYAPWNCRWASMKEQANNMRTNRLLTYNGETKTMSQWAETVGIKADTIQCRLKYYGWSVEEALTIPTGGRRTKHE